MDQTSEVTHLLEAVRRGEDGAVDRLVPLLYGELRFLARRQLRRQGPNPTLDSTALVHEAYLRLVDRDRAGWRDRSHFLAVAALAMRHILVDRARRRTAVKRGQGAIRVTLAEGHRAADPRAVDLLAVDQALTALAALNERLARLVEMRFFGGLTEEEIGEVMKLSQRTVRRDWRKARAFLFRALEEVKG